MPDYRHNLARTLELTQLCFDLKEAYLKSRNPDASQEQITRMLCDGISARKTAAWTSHAASTKR